jgi:hypothetical protein
MDLVHWGVAEAEVRAVAVVVTDVLGVLGGETNVTRFI